jgi:lipid-A-disaccharide synthase
MGAEGGYRPLKVMLVAGEPSGDLLGARLMRALKRLTGDRVAFSGVGGEAMGAEGLTSLFPMSELTIMGVVEILPKARHLLGRVAEVVAAARAARPDVLVTIDSPAFSFRVGKRLKGAGIPLVHYVAPTVWAWRPGRARVIARFLDHLLVLLPFEPPWFENVGLPCTFVGHSVVEDAPPPNVLAEAGRAFRSEHGIMADAPVVCMLPGSRRSEVTLLLPRMADALDILAPRFPGLVAVVPTVPHVHAQVADAVARWPVRAVVVPERDRKLAAMAASDVALAASGTVTLELALARVPMAVTYRVNPITAFAVRLLSGLTHASLINIMNGREIVPEFLQEKCTGPNLAEAVARILVEPEARERQIQAMDDFLKALGQGGVPPGERAARAVLDLLAARGTLPPGVVVPPIEETSR